VAFWFCSGHSALSLAGFIGPNFPINRRRRPNAEIRSRSERVRFVHSPPLRLQKRLRLRKSELDNKTMLFSKSRASRGGTQPALSRVIPAWCVKEHWSTNRHRFDSSRGPVVTEDINSTRITFRTSGEVKLCVFCSAQSYCSQLE
jgi:hypothetical protein